MIKNIYTYGLFFLYSFSAYFLLNAALMRMNQ